MNKKLTSTKISASLRYNIETNTTYPHIQIENTSIPDFDLVGFDMEGTTGIDWQGAKSKLNSELKEIIQEIGEISKTKFDEIKIQNKFLQDFRALFLKSATRNFKINYTTTSKSRNANSTEPPPSDKFIEFLEKILLKNILKINKQWENTSIDENNFSIEIFATEFEQITYKKTIKDIEFSTTRERWTRGWWLGDLIKKFEDLAQLKPESSSLASSTGDIDENSRNTSSEKSDLLNNEDKLFYDLFSKITPNDEDEDEDDIYDLMGNYNFEEESKRLGWGKEVFSEFQDITLIEVKLLPV